MDKISDLIEGAKVSGRYKIIMRQRIGGTTCRFVAKDSSTPIELCPLAVAVLEGGDDVSLAQETRFTGDVERWALSLPLSLIQEVRKAADYGGSDGIDILRKAGY